MISRHRLRPIAYAMAALCAVAFTTISATPSAATPHDINCRVVIGAPHQVGGSVEVSATGECSAVMDNIAMTVEVYLNGRHVDRRFYASRGWANLTGQAAASCRSGVYRGEAVVDFTAPAGYYPHRQRGLARSPDYTINC